MQLIHPAVLPLAGEVVVGKHRVNALYGTALDLILRANTIDTLLILGYATSGVVLSTVRYAADLDYRLVVIEDCCADQDPDVHDFLTQTVGLELGKVEPVLRQTGLKFFGHLDLLPGDYSVRVLVRNAVTGQTGLEVVPVTVPAFAEAGPVLLPPLFPEPPTRWVLVPESLPPGEARPEYPFMQQQQPYVPASRPTVAPGEEVQVSLVDPETNWEPMNEVYNTYFPAPRPARSYFGTTGFRRKGQLLQIDCIAYVD